MPNIFNIDKYFTTNDSWRIGGHRGPMSASQIKAKKKARKKRKANKK